MKMKFNNRWKKEPMPESFILNTSFGKIKFVQDWVDSPWFQYKSENAIFCKNGTGYGYTLIVGKDSSNLTEEEKKGYYDIMGDFEIEVNRLYRNSPEEDWQLGGIWDVYDCIEVGSFFEAVAELAKCIYYGYRDISEL